MNDGARASGVPFNIESRKSKFKCKDCTERYPGCHDKCESYKKAREEQREIKWKLSDIHDMDRSLGRQRHNARVIHRKEGDKRK